MNIEFPKVPATATVNTTFEFPANADGKDVTCDITTEALMDHFGATGMYLHPYCGPLMQTAT